MYCAVLMPNGGSTQVTSVMIRPVPPLAFSAYRLTMASVTNPSFPASVPIGGRTMRFFSSSEPILPGEARIGNKLDIRIILLSVNVIHIL